MHRVRSVLAVLAIAAGGTLAACGGKAAPRPAPASATKLKLVVLIVIDQWPSWIFDQQRTLFSGGIGRALREGAIVPRATIEHANTFTAPGHASLGTGAPPRVHGIVGNYAFRRDEGRDRPSEYDVDALPFRVGPPYGNDISADDGSSGKALRVDGIADALRAGTGGAGKSVSIALKSRSACLLAGRKPDLAIWYEPGAGGMTTSAAYARAVPEWLAAHAKTKPASRFFDATWTPHDAAALASATKLPDDGPGEFSNHGLGAAFPHSLVGTAKPHYAIYETPFADELVAETVLAAIDGMQLGADDAPDLLAVSFGAHDYAGHSWGPESWEVLDLTQRLDATLGILFDTLDARVGKDAWAAVITSDHGATPLVERGSVPNARRIGYAEIEQTAEAALRAHLGEGPWVAKLTAGNLYLSKKFRDLPADVRGAALEAAAKALATIPNIGFAGRMDRFEPDCAGAVDLDLVVCNARVDDAAGELYVYPAAGSVITENNFGTGHDAPFADNREIPILVIAPGLAGKVGTGTQLQVAPTISALLGVPPPTGATAPPLLGITAVRR